MFFNPRCTAPAGRARVALMQARQKAGVVQCPPDCSWEAAVCPPNCTAWGGRRCYWRRKESKHSLAMKVNRSLRYIWMHSGPPRIVPQPSVPKLLLISVTFPHVLQLLKLEHCARVLQGLPGVLWIVVEDSSSRSPHVAELLRLSNVPHRHLTHGPTRNGGNSQRNAALELIRRERMRGVVYNMDDDNAYDASLWAELRTLHPMRVGVFAVRRHVWAPEHPEVVISPCDGHFSRLRPGQMREQLIERPTYLHDGRFGGFESGWCDPSSYKWRKVGPRKFCLDMGGFAFDAALLMRVEGAPWRYSGHGGESELVERLLPNSSAEDLQPLANCVSRR